MSKMGKHVLNIILNEYDGDIEAYENDLYKHPDDTDCPECIGQYIDVNNICKQCGQNFNDEGSNSN